MIDIGGLKWTLNKIKRDSGLIGGSLNVAPLKQEKKHIDAAISLKNYEISFQIDPNLDDMLLNSPEVKGYLESCSVANPIDEMCKKIILHEIWHWKRNYLTGQIGCPTDLVNLNRLMETIYFTLKDEKVFSGISDEKKQLKITNDVSNLFEDLLVNTNLAYEHKSDCLSLVYYDQGLAEKEYGLVGEAFLKLQMGIWGSEGDKKLLSSFYSEKYSDKTDGFVKKTLEDMCISGLNASEVVKVFRNMGEWERLSKSFAKNIAELLKQESGGSGQDSQEGKGGGSKAESSDQGESGEGSEAEDGSSDKEGSFPTIAKSLDREIDEKAEKEIILSCYGREAGKACPPKLIKNSRVLSVVYDHLSEKIPIKASAQKDGFDLPIAPLSFENFDFEEHRLEDVDFSKVVADMDSPFEKELNFQVPNHSYTVFAPYKKVKERLPDIMFLFDCSGSMNDSYEEKVFGASWGVGSKYHYALLGAFGAVKWLRSEKIAPYLKYNTTLFSNTTRSSGWKGYHELDKAVEKFWEPEFGGTEIDMNILSPELAVPPCVIIFISDGGIFNWGNIKEDFRAKTKKHLVSYIQIKDETQTGKDLKQWGSPVYHVSKKEDLHGLIIDLTKQSFKKHVRGL
ncbi:MAG: hypothetical protein Q8N77_05775 [Nanoarchaeota archaeon]|nr:hypothetical protein [Nanoarchaeota archaeon]